MLHILDVAIENDDVFFLLRDLVEHCKKLTRRSAKESDIPHLKLRGRAIAERFYDMFPDTEHAIVVHLLLDHSPKDLRAGYLQGLYAFESFWGYLASLRTRHHNPIANIMAKHRLMLLSFRSQSAEGDHADLIKRLESHPRTNVRGLAKLFNQKSGVESALPRIEGEVDARSAQWARRCGVEIPSGSKALLRALLSESPQLDNDINLTSWRPVASLTIGGVARVPESHTKETNHTRSHYFQERKLSRKEESYGSLLACFFLPTHQTFVAEVRMYHRSRKVAKRSRMPLVNTSMYVHKFIWCVDIGDLVVLATPARTKSRHLKVVLPYFRGYGD